MTMETLATLTLGGTNPCGTRDSWSIWSEHEVSLKQVVYKTSSRPKDFSIGPSRESGDVLAILYRCQHPSLSP